MMETDRLVIRPFQEADIDDFYEYMKLESTAQYEDFTPYSYEECVALVKRRAAMDGVFAVVLKSSGKLIGDINYSDKFSWQISWQKMLKIDNYDNKKRAESIDFTGKSCFQLF